MDAPLICNSGVHRKNFWGFNVMAGLVGGSGGLHRPDYGKFAKNLLKTFAKMHYFSLFFKKISKLCVKFLSVWTKNTIGLEIFEKILKIFDENSIEKFNFYLFLGKVVAKTTAFGNNIVFLQQFFRFGRGFEPPNPPPCARH